jgi:hypothetical protein
MNWVRVEGRDGSHTGAAADMADLQSFAPAIPGASSDPAAHKWRRRAQRRPDAGAAGRRQQTALRHQDCGKNELCRYCGGMMHTGVWYCFHVDTPPRFSFFVTFASPEFFGFLPSSGSDFSRLGNLEGNLGQVTVN